MAANTVNEILPMEVADVVANEYYVLKSLDGTQKCHLPCGLVEMKSGNVVAIGENKYIELIIPEEADEENAPEPDPLCELTQESQSTMGTEQNESVDRHMWQYDETICLIQSMSNHIDDLNHARKRKFVFQNVSNDMLSNGFSVTSFACQNKWKNLLRSYKSCKDHKNKTGRGPSRFLFFDAMDNLLGEKPSNKCDHTLESSNLMNIDDLTPPTSTETEDDMGENSTAASNVLLVQNNAPPRKRPKKNNTHQGDFVSLKKDEYEKRQKRHEEKIEIQTAKLKLEQEKVKLLKKLVEQE